MIFQRKFVQHWKYIFDNGMCDRSGFSFFFLHGNISAWIERHRHKFQKGRRHGIPQIWRCLRSLVLTV